MTDIEKILDECGWPKATLPFFGGGTVRFKETVYAPNEDAKIALLDAANSEFPKIQDVEATE